MILATSCACKTWCGDRDCPGLEVPAFLRLTKEERLEGWRNAPAPSAPISFDSISTRPNEDPATTALREELATGKKRKSTVRIEKMLAKKEEPRDHSQERWDSRTNRWVPLQPQPRKVDPRASQAVLEAPEKAAKPARKRRSSVA